MKEVGERKHQHKNVIVLIDEQPEESQGAGYGLAL
jgi:hypothetical protein